VTPEQQLRRNLIAVHAIEESEPWSQELARRAIVGSDLDMIVCKPPEGWPHGKCAMFGRLYAATYRVHLDGRPVKARATETQRQAKGL
jgi:hypothetical protein